MPFPFPFLFEFVRSYKNKPINALKKIAQGNEDLQNWRVSHDYAVKFGGEGPG